jgi:hypothetical protein
LRHRAGVRGIVTVAVWCTGRSGDRAAHHGLGLNLNENQSK